MRSSGAGAAARRGGGLGREEHERLKRVALARLLRARVERRGRASWEAGEKEWERGKLVRRRRRWWRWI